ncbi:hypothetical protein, partial [Pseudoalteromonas sp. S1727]|uniref:hypothetical protein n=1 Tax=Pseudoalteromonas sp. S1727 TaxID=2066514 RepID=UPI001BB11004
YVMCICNTIITVFYKSVTIFFTNTMLEAIRTLVTLHDREPNQCKNNHYTYWGQYPFTEMEE